MSDQTPIIATLTDQKRQPTTLALVALVVLHLLLLTAGLTWARFSYERIVDAQRFPVPNQEPIRLTTLYDDPGVVSDEQLRHVLYKLRPALRGMNPKINHVDHALRFWGVEATFSDPRCLSGVELRELLLDHRHFRDAWKQGTKPLLVTTPDGIRPRVKAGDSSTSHVDHMLATLAEVGTPLDYPVITPDGESSVRAMVDHSLHSFGLNQEEYEWSAMIWALYLAPQREWITGDGQRITFDRLARRIMRQELRQGVCYGNHRLYALVLLLRVDEKTSILSSEARAEIIAHLQRVTRILVANQSADGYWDRNWDGSADDPEATQTRRLSRRILATGHALEWWAMAPEEVLPPREVVVRAAQWLCREIDALSGQQVSANYTFLSHAGRALALWRGKFPYEVELEEPAAFDAKK